MRTGLPLILLALILSRGAVALPPFFNLEDCRNPLRAVAKRIRRLWSAPALKPLEENAEKRIYPNGLALAGKLLRPGESFAPGELKDDHYIFMVLRHAGREYVMYGVRAPGESSAEPGKNLATHSALFKQASLLLGLPPASLSVVAAGQFQVLNGEVARVDNRSGSWRGGKPYLDYGVDALIRCGLPVAETEGAPQTKRDNYSEAGPDIDFHAEADEIADQRRRVDADPALSRVRAKIVALHSSLYRDFPELRDPETPGYLDPAKIYSGSYLDPERKLDPEVRADLSMVRAAFRILQVDGPHTAAIYFNEMPEAKVMELLELGNSLHQKKSPRK